jgi:hypothetical protein
LNGGGKLLNKENMVIKNGTSTDYAKSDDNISFEMPKTEERNKLERRIYKALKYLEQKYNSFIKDNKGAVDDGKNDVKKFEDYIRSLQGEELEQFLAQTEQEYKDNAQLSQTSRDEELHDVKDIDDAKSISSISEIPQEEIIMMTNLSSTISTQPCASTKEQSFGK